eukprot:CAMPEP_0182857610 /NCGR_PEP_ID=MMETSP0034_2-20130328/3147_1 /TAXON_ID=156128 /ORGANISM="Nephroselmis pyriformis, Strain CCMP717" /LENGTH=346 /DNA_ID=CAMNT_0024988861 /DNA_START=886 /DNA_END=1928 /DNA_ORIENTATION=-
MWWRAPPPAPHQPPLGAARPQWSHPPRLSRGGPLWGAAPWPPSTVSAQPPPDRCASHPWSRAAAAPCPSPALGRRPGKPAPPRETPAGDAPHLVPHAGAGRLPHDHLALLVAGDHLAPGRGGPLALPPVELRRYGGDGVAVIPPQRGHEPEALLLLAEITAMAPLLAPTHTWAVPSPHMTAAIPLMNAGVALALAPAPPPGTTGHEKRSRRPSESKICTPVPVASTSAPLPSPRDTCRAWYTIDVSLYATLVSSGAVGSSDPSGLETADASLACWTRLRWTNESCPPPQVRLLYRRDGVEVRTTCEDGDGDQRAPTGPRRGKGTGAGRLKHLAVLVPLHGVQIWGG